MLPAARPPRGVRHVILKSAAMRKDVGFNIYLPPDYESPGTRRYPVLYWLHGAGGHESQGVAQAALLDKAIGAGRVPPVAAMSDAALARVGSVRGRIAVALVTLALGFGSIVTLVDDEGVEETWTIVGPQETNPRQGRISDVSPVGAALLGKHAGDRVIVSAPGGPTVHPIKSVQ